MKKGLAVLGIKGERAKVRQLKEGSKERESFLFFWKGVLFRFLRGKRPREKGFVLVLFLARERKEPNFVLL